MENISKALELLRLPEDLGQFNGVVNTKVKSTLIEERTTDFTKMVGGKPTVTTEFKVTKATSLFGVYALNHLSNYLHGFGFDVFGQDGSSYSLVKEGFTKTITAGPFAGKEYWFPWQKVNIYPVDGGFDMELLSEPWMNTDTKGFPEPTNHVNPKMSITRIDIVKTKTTTTTGIKSYPVYTKEQLLAMGLSEISIAEAQSTVFKIKQVDSAKFITSLSIDIEADGDNHKGVTYINGVPVKDSTFRTLTTSFGQKAQDFITEWRLYNGKVNDTVYGCTWRKRFLSSADATDLKVVAGSTTAYDATTNTLTYNQNEADARLLFYMEFKPAQGKNENWGTIKDLHTGMEKVWA